MYMVVEVKIGAADGERQLAQTLLRLMQARRLDIENALLLRGIGIQKLIRDAHKALPLHIIQSKGKARADDLLIPCCHDELPVHRIGFFRAADPCDGAQFLLPFGVALYLKVPIGYQP